MLAPGNAFFPNLCISVFSFCSFYPVCFLKILYDIIYKYIIVKTFRISVKTALTCPLPSITFLPTIEKNDCSLFGFLSFPTFFPCTALVLFAQISRLMKGAQHYFACVLSSQKFNLLVILQNCFFHSQFIVEIFSYYYITDDLSRIFQLLTHLQGQLTLSSHSIIMWTIR